MDPSSITINSGLLKFESNTIVINSTNFKLDKSGNVTASGTFKCSDKKWGYNAELNSGALMIKNNYGTELASLGPRSGFGSAGGSATPVLYLYDNLSPYNPATAISPGRIDLFNNSRDLSTGMLKIQDNGDIDFEATNITCWEIKATSMRPEYLCGQNNLQWIWSNEVNAYVLTGKDDELIIG